jgi:transcriptional regulator with XRE-family HTH domain
MNGRGSALRRLRQARDLSAARVAELVGVSTHTVYNWERGTTRVPARQIEPLSRALQLRADDLLAVLDELNGQDEGCAPVARSLVGPPSPLARLRLRAKLSQVAAAQTLGISRSSIRVYESGRPVPLGQLRRMAALYRVPMGRLAAAGGVRCPRELDLKTWRPGDLGRVLRVLREWSGLTQGELALRIGASRDAVRAWENGRYQPGPSLRHHLEELYRLPVGVLQRAYAGAEAQSHMSRL